MSKKPTVKMNLSLDKDFYDIIKRNADLNYVRPATWVKQVLMRSVLGNNNDYVNDMVNERRNA